MRGAAWLLVVLGAGTHALARMPQLRHAVPSPLGADTWMFVSLVCGVLAFAAFVLEGRGGVGKLAAGIVAVAAIGTMFAGFFTQVGS